MAGWVAGSNGNNANSASVEVEVEVEAELGKYISGGRKSTSRMKKFQN